MTAGVWRRGPPPSLGWWPASRTQSRLILRWWNGQFWSVPANLASTAEEVERAAAIKSDQQASIRWTDRPADWPERSRT